METHASVPRPCNLYPEVQSRTMSRRKSSIVVARRAITALGSALVSTERREVLASTRGRTARLVWNTTVGLRQATGRAIMACILS